MKSRLTESQGRGREVVPLAMVKKDHFQAESNLQAQKPRHFSHAVENTGLWKDVCQQQSICTAQMPDSPLNEKTSHLETSSLPQPCLGHPLVPAWLGLQKCFITNSNYHSGFITAFPSSFCLCCLETMLKATSTRSITHLGTNN